jgi:hypothetical protein
MDPHFVSVDGEGVTLPSGEHRYVLLSVGDKSLHRNGEHLTFDEIWRFLWDCYVEDPNATYVGFFLGYDFTQWLRTLPEGRARILLTREGMAQRRRESRNPTPFPVRYRGWEFDMLPHRRFKLRPLNSKDPWLYICDAGSFFQSSFLTAIDPEKWQTPILTADELAVIVEGKQHRSDAAFDATMIRYNVTENAVMSRLMDTLEKGLDGIGVHLSRAQYFGPGQAASVWLELTPCIDAEEFQRITPQDVREAAIAAYYGGWFEIRRHGHIAGASYQYDINSAYPAIIAKLPCLKHGVWTREGANTDLVLMHVQLEGDAAFGPAPYRMEDGRIIRPQTVRGWYWKHEIEAAYDAKMLTNHQTLESWSYLPACTCRPPLQAVADLYVARLNVGKNSPMGRAAKIVYNSIYGKFAQSAGMPRWSNPVYASLITAGCRAMILRAIGSHPVGPSAVSMVATDSVMLDSPHPTLPISDELGAWSEKRLDNALLFAPGIYWDDNSRQRIRDGQSVSLKSRGIRATDIAAMIEQVDWLFHLWEPRQPWPSVKIPLQFNMITCEQALAWGRWDIAGATRQNTHREISADPHDKRASVFADERGWYSIPYPRWAPLESAPYSRRFGEGIELKGRDAPESPDGLIDQLFAEALFGL